MLARLLTLVSVAMLLAVPAAAQVAWESPLLSSPHAPGGLGLHLLSHRQARGGPLGAALTWRPGGGSLGLRVGVVSVEGGSAEALGGLELRARVAEASAGFPLDLAWSSGLGASGSDQNVRLGIPLGLSAGRAFATEHVWLAPFIGARATLEGWWGDDVADASGTLALTMDVGADVAFGRGRDFSIHVGASLGDRSALVVGIGRGPGAPALAAAAAPVPPR